MTLSTALEAALNRIEDMLSDDDGQAFKEARKFLPVGRAALVAQPGSVGDVAELLSWFEEAGGFAQGTKAPHKWVLQAEQELRRLAAAPDYALAAIEAQGVLDVDSLTDAIAECLRDTYHCTRVWEAWNVGTMGQDDFKPVDESETPTEIADAIIDAIRAAISAKKGTK